MFFPARHTLSFWPAIRYFMFALIFVFLLVAFIFATPAVICQDGSPMVVTFRIPPRGARVINFPTDRSLGIVRLVPGPTLRGIEMQAAARGRVVVPAGYYCFFVAMHQLFAKPDILMSFPPDSFDSIQMSATAIEDSEEGQVDRALTYIGHLKGLREVVLDRSDATDTGAAQLGLLPNLQRVSLFSTSVQGKCLKQLTTIKSLNNLRLADDAIAAENLKYLADMHGLIYLSLARTGLTDASIGCLASCSDITVLDLAGNPDLTDGCLKYLRNLKKLKSLTVSRTKITLRGLTQLKGLPIISIVQSDQPSTLADQVALQKALPQLVLSKKSHTKPVDAETGTLYAPFH